MKRLKNILVWVCLWCISYYFGVVEYAAYDGIWTGKDLIAILSGLGGMIYVFKAVHNV
jgi:hypothetical protein